MLSVRTKTQSIQLYRQSLRVGQQLLFVEADNVIDTEKTLGQEASNLVKRYAATSIGRYPCARSYRCQCYNMVLREQSEGLSSAYILHSVDSILVVGKSRDGCNLQESDPCCMS